MLDNLMLLQAYLGTLDTCLLRPNGFQILHLGVHIKMSWINLVLDQVSMTKDLDLEQYMQPFHSSASAPLLGSFPALV
jgi:hypothetical protein